MFYRFRKRYSIIVLLCVVFSGLASEVVTLQNGLNGYDGCRDTELFIKTDGSIPNHANDNWDGKTFVQVRTDAYC